MDDTRSDKRWRSYASFGLFREEQAERRGSRLKSGRYRASFVFVAVTLLTVTAVFFILQLSRPPKMAKVKTKRFVKEPSSPKEDVSLIPEHPNHRYKEGGSEEQKEQKVIKEKYDDRSPEVVDVIRESQTGLRNRNNIRDIIHRLEVKEKLRKLMQKKRPILFKGVYVRKKKEEGEGTEGAEYFRQINEMLEGDTSPEDKRRYTYSDRASPFQMRNPVEGNDASKKGEADKSRKPITVMLDIYPVTRLEEGDEIPEGQKDALVYLPMRSNAEPVPSAGRNVAYTLVPFKGGKRLTPGKNRMFMKLNLYPKRNLTPMHRRTFGWFKKKEGHVCRLIGHNPKGKPVTAEWKDENGDWVKANYVTLKHWDRRFM